MKTKIDNFTNEYSFLSNFSRSEIILGGRVYPTVEHFYQAGKAETAIEHEYVRTAETPGKAKRRGQKVNMRKDWENIKDKYMKLGLILKFDIEGLGDKLLDTGKAYLEEGNTWNDTYWGVCNGVGQNKLGILLMEVRGQVLERRTKGETLRNEVHV